MELISKNINGPVAVIDMGSNGIRFGIVSQLSRHLPVSYEERAPISLLEAQDENKTIPPETIEEVIDSFLRFKTICVEAKVPTENIFVLATEATRVASNAKEFMDRIFEATGWNVRLLSKQEEALISASGIVGSFYSVNGLTSDCGGGSVELSTCYISRESNAMNGVKVSDKPISLPYGALALKKRLEKCENNFDRQLIYDEIIQNIQQALEEVNPPSELKSDDGYEIYMSGGSFRALGYLSMARKSLKVRKEDGKEHATRRYFYPIPMINGYSISGKALKKLVGKYKDKNPDDVARQIQAFRVSKRRARMVPAVCFLVSAMLEVIPIKCVHFSEGGVRQGLCYQMLPENEKRKDPLFTGVQAYSANSEFTLSDEEFQALYDTLKKALPAPYLDHNHPLQLHRLLPAAIYLANLTSHYPKESRAYVSFHMPLPSGQLANIPGLTHKERATLAIILAYKQGGAVPDPIFYNVLGLVGKKGISVCKYLGRVMEFVYTVSPLHPGIGLLKSGITLKASTLDELSNYDSELTSNNEDEPVLQVKYNSDGEINDNDSGDNYNNNNKNGTSLYPTVKLLVQVPSSSSHLLNAPAMKSLFEELDEKIKARKYDLDEENNQLKCPTLFSVHVDYI
ncbi:Ppx/GppA phosphatase family-domain-containing protein [Cunninghamella echinulata]|nr:Ppx/GppA phosphatase family-domain-containing protein [Cunninghamella echinulata]